MSDLYGSILDVHTGIVGEQLTADAAVGSTTISVVDARTFREEGGLLKIGLDVYTYTSVDMDLNVITLAGGLSRAVVTDDLVEVYPTAQVKRAFIDLGLDGRGEGIWATIPQSLVLTLPDGLRYEGQRETVILEERGPGELIVKDVTAAANVSPNTILPDGSVETHSLQVGITGNLVNDPDFRRNFWQPPKKFSVAGPDTVYTDSNFMRITGTSELNVAHDGGTVDDWDWWLTDIVPVDPGRSVRVKATARRDATAITGTLAEEVRVRIVFYKADHLTWISGADQIMALDATDDMLADTWTDIECSSLVPEGYTHFKAGVQVTNLQAGTVDFIKPEIQVLWNRAQSDNYVEATQGWNFDTDQAQVENLNVLGNVGVDVMSARQVMVDGNDIMDAINAYPSGAIGLGQMQSGTNTGNITSASEIILFNGSLAGVKLGVEYMIVLVFSATASANNTVADFFIRYTTGSTGPGSAPAVTVTSPILAQWVASFATTIIDTKQYFHFYTPAADYDNLKFALTAKASPSGGAGNVFINQGLSFRPIELAWIDVGPNTASGNGVLAQISKASGSADPAAPTTYTKSWYATWTRSYDSDLGIRTGDDGDKCYQGYYSGTHGNTRSLVGFDYADIQSKLSGASISKVTLTFRVQHAWAGAGMTVGAGSHSYTSKPSTWSSGSVNSWRWSWAGQKEGSTYTHDITSIGSELKAGTTRGIGFGPAPSNSASAYYGYMYGGTTSGSRPKLTITYSK